MSRGAVAFLAAFAAAILPPPPVSVSAWAEEHLVVPAESGSPYPGRWSNDLAPYLVEPMDCCAFDHPARQVTIMGSAQTGKSAVLLNVAGYVIDRAPAPMLLMLPTIDEQLKFNRLKLAPMIEATPALRAKVREATSRDEASSTIRFKRFDGGSLTMTGANASAGLQMISVRVLLADEVDEYPLDVGGRGDPISQARARQKAWRARGTKTVLVSTPGIAGHSRIAAEFEAGDQRRLYVVCPQCGARQALRWEAMRWRRDHAPVGAFMVCELNGCVIEHADMAAMRRGAVWLKTYPGEAENPAPPLAFEAEELERWQARGSAGREPSFHLWQAYSPFVSWDDTVEEYLRSEGDQQARIAFRQQALGLPADMEGEAPPVERLMERREAWPVKRIPPGVLVTFGAVDVQGDRLEWAVYGFDRGLGMWRIDGGVLQGDPNGDEVWGRLDQVMAERYEDAWGNLWPVDRWGIDSGYLTNRVYLYARRHAPTGRLVALDGRSGWRLPALGKLRTVSFKAAGRTLKVQIAPVGTWDLKSELYGKLRLTIDGPDADGVWPKGAMRFGQDVGPDFFQQLTAEVLVDKARRTGVTVQEWRKTGPNEQHDLAVYCLALARGELDGFRADQWATLEAQRLRPVGEMQGDLAAFWTPKVAPELPAPAKRPEVVKPAAETERPAARKSGWLPKREGRWI